MLTATTNIRSVGFSSLPYTQVSRFEEAHKYVGEARRLAVKVGDRVRAAQFDYTRAQVFIAEKKFKEAEAVAKSAVRALDKSGHQCLLTDALITYGIALARLKQTERAQFTFQKAIEVAHQVGALNKAGLAALTLIEELEELAPDTLYLLGISYQGLAYVIGSRQKDLLEGAFTNPPTLPQISYHGSPKRLIGPGMHESGVHPRCAGTFVLKDESVAKTPRLRVNVARRTDTSHGVGPDLLNRLLHQRQFLQVLNVDSPSDEFFIL